MLRRLPSRGEQQGLTENGAEGGSRTHTWLPTEDFESSASAIPPLRRHDPA